MPSILDQIITYKREFVDHCKRVRPVAELKSRLDEISLPASFAAAIHRGPEDLVSVIAEVKKASPSKGVIREDYVPAELAATYADHGAAAISVLTDEQFFQGHLDHLREVHRALPDIPLLRKDFVIDEYQIFEAREAGASAILLITSCLDKFQLQDYRALANELNMDALTEVHTEAEADRAAEYGARIIGVNNRDLHTFNVDLEQTGRVIKLLGGPQPGFIFVGESGISTAADVVTIAGYGADAILVGESLMRREIPGEGILELLGVEEVPRRRVRQIP